MIVGNENCQEFAEAVTVVSSLKACTKQKDLYEGSKLHADIIRRGFLQRNIFIGNTLVNMYAKCGALLEAQQVFDQLPLRSAVSWNALIAAYVQQGHGEKAIDCYEGMKCEGFSPSAVTFACVVKACASIGDSDKGMQIHTEISKHNLLSSNIMLGTAVMDMHAKLCAFEKSQDVFEGLPVRDVVSWTTVIAGFAQHGDGEKALNCFERMQWEGLSPNEATFLCILRACSSIRSADKGKKIHDEITRQGLLGKDSILGTALMDMYAKCGALSNAQQVFDELPVRNIVSWNVLIAAYSQCRYLDEVLSCFEQMQYEGLPPDIVTFSCIVNLCGSIGVVEIGEKIHSEITRAGLLGKDLVLATALVDMYAKCGATAKAQEAFDELPVRDIVCWNALIAGYSQHGCGDEALHYFERMQHEGPSPDEVTFACILKACGSIGAAQKGTILDAEIVRMGLLGKNSVIGNALVDMYVKCGSLEKAHQLFEKLPVRNIVSWNILIVGYSQHGHDLEALICFEQMLQEGCCPDEVTLLGILNACTCLGLLEEGQIHFNILQMSHGFIPTVDHYTRMVDLFGCEGHFDKAMTIIEKMPIAGYAPFWFAILSACRKWGNVKLGRFAFDRAVHLDNMSAATYVYMTAIYVAAGMPKEAEEIEAMRLRNETWTMLGCRVCISESGVFGSGAIDSCGLMDKGISIDAKCIAHKLREGIAQILVC